MNELQQKLDSREVAEMVGKAHDKLLRDIRTYIEQLHSPKLVSQISLRNLSIKMREEKNIRAT